MIKLVLGWTWCAALVITSRQSARWRIATDERTGRSLLPMFDWSRTALLTEQVASAECRANLYTTLSRDYDADSVKVDPSRRLLRMMRSGYSVPGRGLLHRGPQLGSCLNVVSQYI